MIKLLLPIVIAGTITLGIYSYSYMNSSHHSISQSGSEITGNSNVTPDDLAEKYVLQYRLLQKVNDVERSDCNFNTYGPGYKMVFGKDLNGNDKYVWLIGDRSDSIKVVAQALAKDGITEQDARNAVKSKGLTIDQIFLAPLIFSPFRENGVLAWYIHFTNGTSQFVYFKTGKLVDVNHPTL